MCFKYNAIQYNTLQYNTTMQYFIQDIKIKITKHLLKGEIVRLVLCENEYPQIKS